MKNRHGTRDTSVSRRLSDEKQNGGPFVISPVISLQFESVRLNVAITNPFLVCKHPNFIKNPERLFQQGSRIMFNSITFHIFEISRATVIVSIRDTNDLIWQIGITKQNCNYPTVIPTKPFASHVFSYHPYLKLDINATDMRT